MYFWVIKMILQRKSTSKRVKVYKEHEPQIPLKRHPDVERIISSSEKNIILINYYGENIFHNRLDFRNVLI